VPKVSLARALRDTESLPLVFGVEHKHQGLVLTTRTQGTFIMLYRCSTTAQFGGKLNPVGHPVVHEDSFVVVKHPVTGL
jgi:hypothetical protein